MVWRFWRGAQQQSFRFCGRGTQFRIIQIYCILFSNITGKENVSNFQFTREDTPILNSNISSHFEAINFTSAPQTRRNRFNFFFRKSWSAESREVRWFEGTRFSRESMGKALIRVPRGEFFKLHKRFLGSLLYEQNNTTYGVFLVEIAIHGLLPKLTME